MCLFSKAEMHRFSIPSEIEGAGRCVLIFMRAPTSSLRGRAHRVLFVFHAFCVEARKGSWLPLGFERAGSFALLIRPKLRPSFRSGSHKDLWVFEAPCAQQIKQYIMFMVDTGSWKSPELRFAFQARAGVLSQLHSTEGFVSISWCTIVLHPLGNWESREMLRELGASLCFSGHCQDLSEFQSAKLAVSISRMCTNISVEIYTRCVMPYFISIWFVFEEQLNFIVFSNTDPPWMHRHLVRVSTA